MSHNPSDYGYSTGAVSMRCRSCDSTQLNCCDGHGNKFTYKILNEDGQFVAGFRSLDDANEGLHILRTDRATAHNCYEVYGV